MASSPRSLVALVTAVLAAMRPPAPKAKRSRAIRAVEPPPPPALDGVPHAQPAEQFNELAWRAIGPDGRMTTCTILAPASGDGFEVWVTAGRGAGIITPIRTVRSLRTARRVAHGLRARWGAARRLAGSEAFAERRLEQDAQQDAQARRTLLAREEGALP